MFWSWLSMRPMVSAPVSPAPTMRVRGRRGASSRRVMMRLFLWKMRHTMRIPPSKNTRMMAEAMNTRMGSLTSMTHKNTAPMSVERNTENTI